MKYWQTDICTMLRHVRSRGDLEHRRIYKIHRLLQFYVRAQDRDKAFVNKQGQFSDVLVALDSIRAWRTFIEQ